MIFTLKKVLITQLPLAASHSPGRLSIGALSMKNQSLTKKVLIVDDEEDIRAILMYFFRGKGFETLEAETGEEALEYLAKDSPDIVLLDLIMPGMGGLEALKKIHDSYPNTGVIVVTGVQDEKIASKALLLGAADYVSKPFDIRYLEFATNRLLMAS